MKGINKVLIIGRLGKDPVIRYTTGGSAIASMSIATGESWRDKSSGETKDKTEWHKIVAFGKLAEIIGKYPKKGSQVYAEGKLSTRKWQDKNGIDRYTTEIVAKEIQMLGGCNSTEGSYTKNTQSNADKEGISSTQEENDFFDDIIPS